MGPLTLLVIGDPGAPQMELLKELPPEVKVVVSDDPAQLKAAAPSADVLLNGGFHQELFRKTFPLAVNARWVHNMSTGVEGILTPEVVASPIPLTNGRGVFSEVLAEFVAGAILYFAKDFRRMIRSQEAGRWDQFDILPVKGATLAIAGYGHIGHACARLAAALGMKILALRRRAEASLEDPLLTAVYTRDRMLEMLARCDYLLIAAPLTPETEGMIGEREIEALRPDAVLINIGRGPVVVEAALIRALQARRIKGAALDVFDEEPLPAGHAFYALDNVLLSPHCADHLPGWVNLAMMKFLENFRRFWNGQPLENIVDKKAGY
jgi:phosphoglycerate dehydrogenase-like enzyme